MSDAEPFWYLGCPYSAHPGGIEAAHAAAVAARALLVRANVRVFSPVVHSHAVAIAGGIDPLDHGVWLPAEAPIMRHARGLIVLTEPGWGDSRGLRAETEWFRSRGYPIVRMTPGTLPELPDLDAPLVGADGTVRQPYYGVGRQPWDDIVEAGWGPDFAAANALKYLRRTKEPENDLRKARWYYARLVEMREARRGADSSLASLVLTHLWELLTAEEKARLEPEKPRAP